MCGRYVTPATAEAERYFTVHLVRWQFERSFNIAPTQSVPIVRAAEGEREGIARA
jgi:putative SOS response-associated peptidase YedK